MAYDPIDPDALIPGAKITASLALQTRDNPLAVAQGLPSVPIPNLVDLGRALRTANLTTNQVLKSNGAGGFKWGAEPTIAIQLRAAVGGGTWVVPPGVIIIEVQAWGGGGGYGFISAFKCGGSGAYVRTFLPVVPGETLTYSVGAGGGNEATGGMTFIRNAADNTFARAGGGGLSTGSSVGGVASVGGTGEATILADGQRGPWANVGQLCKSKAIAPFSWNGYGSGGFANNNPGNVPGAQGYLRWRYVQP